MGGRIQSGTLTLIGETFDMIAVGEYDSRLSQGSGGYSIGYGRRYDRPQLLRVCEDPFGLLLQPVRCCDEIGI